MTKNPHQYQSKSPCLPLPQELITDLVNRYMERIKDNLFDRNPYYKSIWEERKEVLGKINELKLKSTK